jgi:hypothetical protein
MLARPIARAALAAATAGLLIMASQLPALAAEDGGPGSGSPGSSGPFGGVQCGQAGAPSCLVTAGSPARGGTGSGTGTAGTASPGGCAGTVSPVFGCIPPGCQVTVQTLSCPLGPGAPPPPALGVLVALARALLVLPAPVIWSNPAPGQLQLTGLSTWLWITKAVWAPQSKTASVPGEAVTATATPTSVSWDMGDGATVTCDGPGIPYTSTYSPASASPGCGYTYPRSSAGQPDGAYRATATITWDITWTGPGGAGGTLAPLFTTALNDFRVADAQALNVATGG